MRYNKQKINEHWYWFDAKTGAMKTGFQKSGNKTYYYGTNGIMRYNKQKINGHWYWFDAKTGAMIKR